MTVCILDTSVFCNILRVPGRDQRHNEALRELERLLSEAALLLPLAVIYETGKHIAQLPDGRQRRRTAEVFVRQVKKALAGKAPWTPTPNPDIQELDQLLRRFPDEATRGVSLADLTLIDIFDRQCRLHPTRKVYIWSFDGDLAGYERSPGSFSG